MSTEKTDCDHRCRNACATLAEGLKHETNQLDYFEKMVSECDEPEMKKFAMELRDAHKELAQRMSEKLNIVKTKARVLDEIIASYES